MLSIFFSAHRIDVSVQTFAQQHHHQHLIMVCILKKKLRSQTRQFRQPLVEASIRSLQNNSRILSFEDGDDLIRIHSILQRLDGAKCFRIESTVGRRTGGKKEEKNFLLQSRIFFSSKQKKMVGWFSQSQTVMEEKKRIEVRLTGQ